MLPKVLCFFAIAALAAAAPNSDRQYIDQLQKEYEDDGYDVAQTDEFGKIEDMQQQSQYEDEQNSDLKDIEQFEQEVDEQEVSTEPTEDSSEDIEQVQYGTGYDKDLEQVQKDTGDETQEIEEVDQSTGDDTQEIEEVDQDTGYQPSKIEQVEQEDNDWHDDTNDNGGDDTIHFEDGVVDDLETDSAIGKLFGDSTVQEQEGKYGGDQQQIEVGQESNYNEEQVPVEEVVPSPSYKSNYGSGYSGVHHPSDPFEPEVYTKKPPWHKRFWANAKEKARGFAHKVKETFGRK